MLDFYDPSQTPETLSWGSNIGAGGSREGKLQVKSLGTFFSEQGNVVVIITICNC